MSTERRGTRSATEGAANSERSRREDLLTALIDSVTDIFAILSEDYSIRFVTGNIRTILGWPPDEVYRMEPLALVHPPHHETVHRSLDSIQTNTTREFEIEVDLMKSDGTYRVGRLTGTDKRNDPAIQGIVIQWRDIAEEVRLREESTTRRLYLEGIVGATPDAIIALDKFHRVVEWNRGAEELFGYTAEEAAGKNLDDLVVGSDPEERTRAAQYTAWVLEDRTVGQREAVRTRKDGTNVDVILSGAPIIVRNELIGVVATYKDISLQKRAERQARELLEEKTLILREMRHRIRNDLTLVASLLAVQASKSEDQTVADALDEARKRVEVIGRVYERLDDERPDGVVDPNALLERVVNDLQRSIAPEGIVLRYIGTEGAPRPIAMKLTIALGIIVNELVTNSIKYAFSGRVGSGTETGVKEVAISYRQDSSNLSITVRDTGAGVPAAVERGDEKGYGLTVIEALVAQWSGEIAIENCNGACITVTIPVAYPRPEER